MRNFVDARRACSGRRALRACRVSHDSETIGTTSHAMAWHSLWPQFTELAPNDYVRCDVSAVYRAVHSTAAAIVSRSTVPPDILCDKSSQR
jgi:hypothetical protein